MFDSHLFLYVATVKTKPGWYDLPVLKLIPPYFRVSHPWVLAKAMASLVLLPHYRLKPSNTGAWRHFSQSPKERSNAKMKWNHYIMSTPCGVTKMPSFDHRASNATERKAGHANSSSNTNFYPTLRVSRVV